MAYEAERLAAVAAVRAAAELCREVQGRLVAGDTLTKGDQSPVTIADFAAQAIVNATLTEALGDIAMVGEEDSDDLRRDGATELRDGVVDLLRRHRGAHVSASNVLDWIATGAADASGHRYWTLDPIDGTKGFVRGDQYAIALALIEDGAVRLGVLGCPNLPNADGSVGAIFVASDHVCEAFHGPSLDAVPVRVASPSSLADARFCESVESGHSNQHHSARIAELLGIAAPPYRIDSQCKYAAVARGDASIYLRLPTRADYHEKIWDHAAGKFVVEQAGGRVTDVHGRPLDFSVGAQLTGNTGVVATDGWFHDEILEAVGTVLRADRANNG
jgi:3'(2'), 5'-bisphosphate nucleotidase